MNRFEQFSWNELYALSLALRAVVDVNIYAGKILMEVSQAMIDHNENNRIDKKHDYMNDELRGEHG